jgi:serine/threonine protein kinase
LRTPVSDPQRVGPYRIVGRLGSGGMGWVYLGRSTSGRALAVKVVRPELAADPEFRRRFAREVEAARAVSGAFTAAVVDADALGEPPWLATLYVPAPSLAESVERSGPLPEEQVRVLAAGLTEALKAVHAVGVVHRDLKPSNVLLAEDGPRVIDFGISWLGGSSPITQVGALMGTPPYMSPEQCRGESAGPPSDVFSLGSVLAFAATGAAPFGSGPGVIFRIVHEEPALDAVPVALRKLIGGCLAKAPEDRPDLDTLLVALVALAGPVGLGAVDREPSWPPRSVAEGIRSRSRDLAERDTGRGAGTSVPSCLLLHAQALLDSGLSDHMVREAAGHARH